MIIIYHCPGPCFPFSPNSSKTARRSVMMALLSCATHATALKPPRNCFARLRLALPGTLARRRTGGVDGIFRSKKYQFGHDMEVS